jgi:hypothetical protein
VFTYRIPRVHLTVYYFVHTFYLFLTDITCLHMSRFRHINRVLKRSHVYICLVTDTSVVSYRYQTPIYFLSQTYQLCLTDITWLLISCHRHISCVLQTSHAYICLPIDTSIVSYRHYTVCKTQLMCLWQEISSHVMSVRHNWYVCDKKYIGVWYL